MTETKIYTIVEAEMESNCYIIVSGQKAILIDPNDAKKADDLIQKNGWRPEYIFLTHEHFDHILGLEELRGKYQIPVWASAAASEGIQSYRANMSNVHDIFLYYKKGAFPKERHQKFECRPAEHTFSSEMELLWEGHRFFFRLLPGHSAGSTLIFMDEDRLFSGDYFLSDETPVAKHSGGSKTTLQEEALPYLDTLPSGIHIYPGHGKDFIR